MRKMRILRSVILIVSTACIISILTTVFAIGQDRYPSKPIALVVGLAAGGATDLSARALGKVLERILNQPVIVANKPGASGVISFQYIKNSLADGYTLAVSTTGGLLITHLKEVPYEFFSDFTHLIQISVLPAGLAVNSDSPWKTLKEFVEYAQKNPGKVKYASTEYASMGHILSEQMALQNGFKWVHVPFPGDTPAATALLGKHVDAMVLGTVAWGPFVKAGRFRLLAVHTEKRIKEFPDVPTFTEAGCKLVNPVTANYGIMAPKGLPSDVKEILLSALRQAWKDEEFQGALEKLSIMPVYREGEDLVRFLREWEKETVSVMKQIGLKIIKE